ncbi:AsmA family protein [Piscinibacter terrae]|uniref:AsmA family protein n=1 Tax=Piscinibacter terrae TaxID=2496871 RepID=A0A3N7HTR0_9BURK|nr:hypothetical protein [Albitalea terrae]RQP25707.1 hypothetical protein DZC73_01115 [Albitalea terrae]
MSTAILAIVPRYRRWPAVLGSLAAVLAVVVVCLEVLGWPFLAEPMQRWLSGSLHRRVSFAIDGQTPASVVVRVLGRVRVEAPQLVIGPPAWSKTQHMIRASDAVVSFHYSDLWNAWRGEPLRIRMLEADELEADIERLADGRASWQVGTGADEHGLQLPLFDELKVRNGSLRWRDAVADLRLVVECKTSDASADAMPSAASASAATLSGGLACNAHGQWHKQPVGIVLQTAAPLAWVNRDPAGERVPLLLNASIGDTHATVQGSAVDALGLRGLKARFEAEGTSLADMAQVMDVRLIPRAAFRAAGSFTADDLHWRLDLDKLLLGTSTLSGSIEADRGRTPPQLTGRIDGAWLAWRDIAEAPSVSLASRTRTDLGAFRTLDADLSIDIAQVDFGDAFPRQPLKGRWRLLNGHSEWLPGAGTKF